MKELRNCTYVLIPRCLHPLIEWVRFCIAYNKNTVAFEASFLFLTRICREELEIDLLTPQPIALP